MRLTDPMKVALAELLELERKHPRKMHANIRRTRSSTLLALERRGLVEVRLEAYYGRTFAYTARLTIGGLKVAQANERAPS